MSRIGLVLSGGGARTAFQVGVIRAISDWYGKDDCPFKVMSGTSGGSINACYLSANADKFKDATYKLEIMWRNLRSKNVYNSTIIHNKSYVKTIFNLFKGIRFGNQKVNSILSTQPLYQLISNNINFDRIQTCLDNKAIHSLCITATNYQKHVLTTFVQSNENYFWDKIQRTGIKKNVDINHLMASVSIPFLFPPVKINGGFFGDGNLRNFAPLSPAIRSGAKNIIIIGISSQEVSKEIPKKDIISFGDIFSSILNIILMNSIDVDNERVNRINRNLSSMSKSKELKYIDTVYVQPSIDFCDLADKYDYECPSILKQLLKLIGTKHNSAYLKSYLMFEAGYLNALIDQGYKDAHAYKERIMKILEKSSRVGGDNPREL